MSYVITGRREQDFPSRNPATAAECVASADDMLDQGFAIVSIVDAALHPITLDQLREQVEQVRVKDR